MESTEHSITVAEEAISLHLSHSVGVLRTGLSPKHLDFVARPLVNEGLLRASCRRDNEKEERRERAVGSCGRWSRGREQGRRAGTGDVVILLTPSSSTVEWSSGRSLYPKP